MAPLWTQQRVSNAGSRLRSCTPCRLPNRTARGNATGRNSMDSSHYGWEDALASSIVGIVLILFIIALAIGVWLAVRAVNLVAAAIAAHPQCKPLWAALAAFLLLLGAAIATGN